jgi:hypothetical protein
MRNKRRKLIAVVLLALAALVACVLVFPDREPAWQGRTLGAWLRDFDADKPESRASAADAIRQIGTNALPLIIQRLQHPDRRSPSAILALKLKLFELLSKQSLVKIQFRPGASPRHQALAAIDALGPAAANALPALGKLLHENPPDPRAPYLIARIGPEGLPLLRQALTNKNGIVRTEARVCLEMFNSRSEALFPADGMDVSSFDRRICEFNLRMVRAGFQEYKRQHPEEFLLRDITDMPPPSELPPGIRPSSRPPANPPSRPRLNSPPAGPDNYE